MKILITGNAGMIGSVLADYFHSQGHKIVGIDDLSGGFLRNVQKFVKFYPISILDTKSLNNVFEIEKPQYIVHCAAFAAELLSPFIRNHIYQNIVVGTTNLINCAVNHDVIKFIHFSSIARYGDGNPPFKETDIPNPKDCYGIAKLTNELDLKEAWEHFGLQYSIVAPHNIVSKFQNYFDKFRNVIAIWIRQCINKEQITIFGDGLQKRGFTDCAFICEPVEKLLDSYNTELFNIGSDKDYTILNAAQIVLKEADKRGLNSSIVHLESRREVKIALSDHTKAKKELHFKDGTNLEKLVSEMFDYAVRLPKQNVRQMEYEITKNMYSFWK